MNSRRLLFAASALAVIAAIPMLQPKHLLAQVKAALVRDVDNPDRLPVVLTASVVLDFGKSSATTRFDICWEPGCVTLVPLGYRLVIESVSVQGHFNEGAPLHFAQMLSTVNHQPVEAAIQALVQARDNGEEYYSGTVPVRIKCDPTTPVDAVVTRTSSGSFLYQRALTFVAHGHLVSLN